MYMYVRKVRPIKYRLIHMQIMSILRIFNLFGIQISDFKTRTFEYVFLNKDIHHYFSSNTIIQLYPHDSKIQASAKNIKLPWLGCRLAPARAQSHHRGPWVSRHPTTTVTVQTWAGYEPPFFLFLFLIFIYLFKVIIIVV